MRKRTVLRISRIALVIIVGAVAYIIGNQKGYNDGWDYGYHCCTEDATRAESLEYKSYTKGE